MEVKSDRKIRFLTLDGGGIRGIIPTVVLAKLGKRLQKNL